MGDGVIMDEEWLEHALATVPDTAHESDSTEIGELRRRFKLWAAGFWNARVDVQSPEVTWPSRGLLHDEAQSFLRAVETGFIAVSDTGHFAVVGARPKNQGGRYALLSKSGDGAAVNLEYLIQAGAVSELALDHGWPGDALDFERGEFDAFGYGPDGRVILAMEAKCRSRGADSVEKLLREWLSLSRVGAPGAPTNAGRKYAELVRLCEGGTVVVWVVAANVRWAFEASRNGVGLQLRPIDDLPLYPTLAAGPEETGRAVLWVKAHDVTLHHSGTRGAEGLCTWYCSDKARWSVGVREVSGTRSAFALVRSTSAPRRGRIRLRPVGALHMSEEEGRGWPGASLLAQRQGCPQFSHDDGPEGFRYCRPDVVGELVSPQNSPPHPAVPAVTSSAVPAGSPSPQVSWQRSVRLRRRVAPH